MRNKIKGITCIREYPHDPTPKNVSCAGCHESISSEHQASVLWGIPVIGFSGLMLWMPWLFTKFLPGDILNVAMIIHGDEALLAVGFIFTFHFFHNHLRPENFPMDMVIFTGKMPLSRFKEERHDEYERLVRKGKLDQLLTDPPSPMARRASMWFGLTALVIGIIVAIAMFSSYLLYRL